MTLIYIYIYIYIYKGHSISKMTFAEGVGNRKYRLEFYLFLSKSIEIGPFISKKTVRRNFIDDFLELLLYR